MDCLAVAAASLAAVTAVLGELAGDKTAYFFGLSSWRGVR
jgi:hypothetical protein